MERRELQRDASEGVLMPCMEMEVCRPVKAHMSDYQKRKRNKKKFFSYLYKFPSITIIIVACLTIIQVHLNLARYKNNNVIIKKKFLAFKRLIV